MQTLSKRIPWRLVAVTAAGLVAALPASAADIYGGIGLTGVTLGVSTTAGDQLSFRGEYAGGISVKRDGREGGVDYVGKVKIARFAALADWHPFSGSFRFTGGITGNDISAKLRAVDNGTGGSGATTINGKVVNLTGETLDVAVKYPGTTPYLGFGWGHHNRGGGLGFWADVGAMVGKFKVSATTSLVGKQGITQADIDAELKEARDSVGKYNYFPILSLGLSYQF